MEITRKVEFDAGHRIPDHRSKCRNIHGHRYVLEATANGAIIDNPGAADHGMVIDFSDLKAVMMLVVGEPWDHAFLMWVEDELNCPPFHEMLNASTIPRDHKTVMLSVVPTVENLVQTAFELIQRELTRRGSPLKLSRVRLWETPNCWADVYADDMNK